jgi:hypothetical protein
MLVADMQANLLAPCMPWYRSHPMIDCCACLAPVQLQKGKYVRDHSRLEVQPTGRFFLNMMLGGCLSGCPASSSMCGVTWLHWQKKYQARHPTLVLQNATPEFVRVAVSAGVPVLGMHVDEKIASLQASITRQT